MSKEYSALLDSLLNGEALTESQAYALMHKLAEGELPAALAGALLAGLRAARGDKEYKDEDDSSVRRMRQQQELRRR